MTTMTDDYHKLGDLLQAELAQTQALLATLNLEMDALSEAKPDSLEKLLAVKQQQVRQLEATGHQREILLTALRNDTARNHTASETADPLKNQPQLSALWHELLSVAQQCQTINKLNGSVIELGYRKSQQALNILRGVKTAVDVYDNAGKTSQNTHSNSLVSV